MTIARHTTRPIERRLQAADHTYRTVHDANGLTVVSPTVGRGRPRRRAMAQWLLL